MLDIPFPGCIMDNIISQEKEKIMQTEVSTKVFKGGIQKGTMAWDATSLALDKQVSRLAKELSTDPAVIAAGYTFQKKLKKNQIPGNIGACAPDGGLWFKNGVVIAAFEAKKQGKGGNAIERWYKNAFILRTLNPTVNYVTFTCGKGATMDTPIGKTLALSVYENGKHNFNEYREGKNSVFMNVNGYTDDDIRAIMRKALCV